MDQPEQHFVKGAVLFGIIEPVRHRHAVDDFVPGKQHAVAVVNIAALRGDADFLPGRIHIVFGVLPAVDNLQRKEPYDQYGSKDYQHHADDEHAVGKKIIQTPAERLEKTVRQL